MFLLLFALLVVMPAWHFLFGKRLSRKSDNVVVFPFAFHIAVQQPFKPLRSRLLLYELKPSQASFALCFKSLLMMLLSAPVLVSLFGWRLPFDLSSKGGPASSYATARIALRVTDVLKPPHHDMVETPTRRRKKLLDDLKDRRGYCQLKEETLDHTMWRSRFGRGSGPVVWQITDDDDDVFIMSCVSDQYHFSSSQC